MEDIKSYQEVLNKGRVLKVYIQELKQNVETVCQASFIHRNPYIRTRRAKQHIQALFDAIQHCQDSIFLYIAELAKLEVCQKQEINAYFFIYRFLFDFQDDIKKQEWLHLLMIRNVTCMEKFKTFISYSMSFIQQQEDTIASVYKQTSDV